MDFPSSGNERLSEEKMNSAEKYCMERKLELRVRASLKWVISTLFFKFELRNVGMAVVSFLREKTPGVAFLQ